MSAALHFDQDATCDACGCFGAYQFDGQKLCLDCYESRGSCCAEAEPKTPLGDAETGKRPQQPVEPSAGAVSPPRCEAAARASTPKTPPRDYRG